MSRIISLVCLLLITHASFAQSQADRSAYASVIRELKERIPKGLKKNDIPGLSIALVDENGIIWQEGFGQADRESKTPVTTQTVFRAGSLSKLFTSVAVMQLVEQGKVRLDSSLEHYLPDFSMQSRFGQNVEPPTIRQLLTHYAGLPANYIKGILDEEPKPLESYVSLLADEYYAFRPNTVYCYSGTGYSLLGLLIEEITGKEFINYMEEDILAPLDMDLAAFERIPAIESHLAAGYLGKDKRQQFPICDVPAGGLYANVEGLARFAQMALNKGGYKGRQLIDSASFAQLVAPQNGGHPFDFSMRIGLGWKLDGIAFTYGKNLSHLGKVAGHGGQTVLFRSKVMLALDHGVGVVILTNSSNGKDLAWPMASEALQNMVAAKKGEERFREKSQQESVALEEFPQQGNAYYATRWGVMKLAPRNDKQRIRASIPGRKFLFKKTEDGGYDVRYLLLGFLPLKVGQLNPYHFGFLNKAGMDMMVRTSEGMAQFFGNRIEQDSIPAIWRERTGRYEGEFAQEEPEVIRQVELYVQDGLLLMNLQVPMLSDETVRLAIDPISRDLAYIKGHSRLTGDVLQVVEENGREKLVYAGLPLVKLSD